MADGKTGVAAGQAVMEIPEVADAIRWQSEHATRAHAPCTGRIVRALIAVLATNTEVARRMNNWPGLSLEDAMPLRIAGGLHHLFLTGDAPELGPIYAAEVKDQAQVDAIVVDSVERFDERLAPWFDGPPQTNEAGRSASIMAGLLWLSQWLGPRFELNEMGASAGVNTMMERYFYDLGGVRVGPKDSPMRIVPHWRGPPPPAGKVEITAIRGCDVAPVDLADPDQARRLKAYVWAEVVERIGRIDAAIALAAEKRPDVAEMDAADFVSAMLPQPQEEGVTRVLYHSVMWQYLPAGTRADISAAMEHAGQAATPERPLAWVRLETNRQTFAHELTVKYWPKDDHRSAYEWTLLSQAHPHGAWVEWFGK